MTDDGAFHAREITGLEREFAALVRQLTRATAASDHAAEAVEAKAICNHVRHLCYHHLALRIGETSDDWVWVEGLEDYHIEQIPPLQLRASGRVWCTLPEGVFRQWTEPFAATISHSADAHELSGYLLQLGDRATFLDLPTVRRLIERGEAPTPPAPAIDDGWAFTFCREMNGAIACERS